jgi:hypothetical protein
MQGLIGRERELSELNAALCEALAGEGCLVLVSGEAGIGKTSLVRLLASSAPSDVALVLAGAAYDLSSTPPYGPWLELLNDSSDDGNLLPLPRALDPLLPPDGQVRGFLRACPSVRLIQAGISRTTMGVTTLFSYSMVVSPALAV